MTTVKKLLSMMQLDEFTHVVVLEAERRYYLGGGFVSDVVRRFGHMCVSSTDIREERLIIFVTR